MIDNIRKIKFKDKAAFQIEVVPVGPLTKSNKQHLFTPHRTDFYHVFLFENCSPTHMVDFNPIKIKPYSLLFIDKDRVHQFDRRLKYKGTILVFTDDFFCTSENDVKFLRSTILFNDLTGKHVFKPGPDVFNHLEGICNEINDELKQPADNTAHSLLKNLLHNFLLIAEREKRKQGFKEIKKGANLDHILLFKDLLEKNFTTSKNVNAYARRLHVSEKRLGKATASILGKTPKQLIDERVLLESKRLLAHSGQPVKEISFQLGFEEPTNFIKYFRKHTGKTPVEFRETYLSV